MMNHIARFNLAVQQAYLRANARADDRPLYGRVFAWRPDNAVADVTNVMT